MPAGISFVRHRVAGRLRVTGVGLIGAEIKSLALSDGHLLIVLRKPVRSFMVTLGRSALKESARLEAKAKARRLGSLVLTVVAKNTSAQRVTIHVQIKNLGL